MNEHNNDITEEELVRVEELLRALPPIEPSQALLRDTLRRVEGRGVQVVEGSKARGKGATRLWAGGLLAASGLFAAAAALFVGTRQADMEPSAPSVAAAEKHAEQRPAPEEPEVAEQELEGEGQRMQRGAQQTIGGEDLAQGTTGQGWAGDGGVKIATTETAAVGFLENVDKSLQPSGQVVAGFDGKPTDLPSGDAVPPAEPSSQLEAEDTKEEAQVRAVAKIRASKIMLASDELGLDTGSFDSQEGLRDALPYKQQVGLLDGRDDGDDRNGDGRFVVATGNGVAVVDPNVDEYRWKAANERSEDFETDNKPVAGKDADLADKSEITTRAPDKPAFIEARGYFANTYLPGDAELMALRTEVGAGLIREGRRVALDELAEPVRQPFDAPSDKALALYLASDLPAVETGPQRMTLQLGLKGAMVAPTRRSAVNLALVVDVANIADEPERRSLWAVAEATARELQPGDRLTVVASGTARVLTTTSPAEVTRFLAEAYEARGAANGATMPAALDGAYTAVRAGIRTDAPIGVDLVVLATSAELGDIAALKNRAHQEALGGIQTSVIGAGGRPETGALRALAMSGQGRSSSIGGGDGVFAARTAVQAELSAAGRVVARAVRLRVRLGAGVQLVSVVGSHRLDTRDADKVRAAEKAIDLKVAEATGIRADRGEDEDGIQIVIPAFMAGDDHVILFDVVVDGPGPVMDVRARFKDLVTLGNGEVSASLSLPSGQAVSRAEQWQVGRNIAAHHVADTLRTAATRLRADDLDGANQALVHGLAKVDELLAARRSDPGLIADRRLLLAYERAVAGPLRAGDRSDIARVASSMRLAARLELGAR